MSGHPRVIGYLQRAVNHEFDAARQYTLQAVQAEVWGMASLAGELRQGVQEEIRHAEVFIRRMLLLGVTPRDGQGHALPVGRSHAELLRFGLATEADAIRLYEEACLFCKHIGDAEQHETFARVLADEVRHYRELKRRLEVLGSKADVRT